MKILVADDDKTLREELAVLLREDGHAILTAADGGEALRTVERESFDVALLDLRMPKATGLDVLHRLRVVRPETAVGRHAGPPHRARGPTAARLRARAVVPSEHRDRRISERRRASCGLRR